MPHSNPKNNHQNGHRMVVILMTFVQEKDEYPHW